MSLAYYRTIIGRGGGLITCPNHLGVMVALPENAARCPAGWGFVPMDSRTTPELIAEVVREVSLGRATWPTKDDGSRPTTFSVRRV